jgi:hypothetical protein
VNGKNLPTALVIWTGSPIRFHLVVTVGDAADFLFDNWADHDCPEWKDAMNRCAWANHGKVSVEDARDAFFSAMKAAGIPIDPALALLK